MTKTIFDTSISAIDGDIQRIVGTITEDKWSKPAKRYMAQLLNGFNNVIAMHKFASVNDARAYLFNQAAQL